MDLGKVRVPAPLTAAIAHRTLAVGNPVGFHVGAVLVGSEASALTLSGLAARPEPDLVELAGCRPLGPLHHPKQIDS